MTATSAHGFRVAIAATEYAGDDPVDTSLARVVANNALHFADEAAQVRCAWVGRTGDFLTTQTIGATDIDTWLPIVTMGPFPLSLTEAGAYLLRARFHGAASAANAVTFRAALAPILGGPSGRGFRYARDQIEANGTNVLEATTSSTTAAYLAATGSRTTLAASELAAEADTSMSTVSAAAGSTYYSVNVALFALHIWATSSTSGTQPQLTGFYGAEFVG